LRACSAAPSLRIEGLFIAVRNALAKASRNGFRVLHFSVQADHVHLLVEADAPSCFRRGVQGLAIRVAKAVNRRLGRRGSVWEGRYHARILRTPREVRNALVYVLNNIRKHVRDARGLDSRSSARWFDGWRGRRQVVTGRSPLANARTWLARVGWRRRGLIDVDECPQRRRRRGGRGSVTTSFDA
jgi:REP element-mobilizing transposase RayT